MLSINLMFSPINLPFRKPVWSLLISFGITDFIRFAIAFAAILQSQLRRVRGRQFLMKCGSASFFGMSLMIPRLCVIERAPLSYEQLSALIKRGDKSFQKILQNSAGSPSVPESSDLLKRNVVYSGRFLQFDFGFGQLRSLCDEVQFAFAFAFILYLNLFNRDIGRDCQTVIKMCYGNGGIELIILNTQALLSLLYSHDRYFRQHNRGPGAIQASS